MQAPQVELSGWWYLSFVIGSDFAGGAIVLAQDEASALTEATRRDINPGGEVMLAPIPIGFLPDESYRNRLLSKIEIKTMWPDAKTVGEIRDEGDVHVDTMSKVCADCNPGRPT